MPLNDLLVTLRSKRRYRYLFVGAIIVLFSALITLFIVYGVGEKKEPIQTVVVTKNTITLEPEDLFGKSTTDETSESTTTVDPTTTVSTHGNENAQKLQYITVYPEWKSGNTTVSAADPITSVGNFIRPLWSPIGLDIAYCSADENSLYISSAQIPKPGAEQPKPLFTEIGIGKSFSWSPDGMTLLIQLEKDQAISLSLTGEVNPSNTPAKAIWEQDGAIWWQPDENRSSVRISGTNDRFFQPVLSPDGTRVVYSGQETGLYITTLTGIEAGVCETICVGKGRNPSWLADSRGIVYDIAEIVGNSIIDGDLWFATVDGKERTNITATTQLSESCPVVSSDCERIAFVSDGAIYIGRFSRFF